MLTSDSDTRNPNNLPLAVCLLLEDLNGRILVVSRKNNDKIFGLIGGKVDPGETPLEAVVRETEEECGLVIPSDRLALVYEGVCPGEQDYWCLTFRFLGYGANGPVKNTEGTIVKWMKPKELLAVSPFAGYNRAVFTTCYIPV